MSDKREDGSLADKRSDAFKVAIGLRQVYAALAEVYLPRGADIWMTAKNPLLDNQRPFDLIVAGETQRVLAVIEGLADGIVV